MSVIDKISGRFKKAVGDVTGDPGPRREGIEEERKGEAKEEQVQAEQRAEEKAEEVGRREARTD